MQVFAPDKLGDFFLRQPSPFARRHYHLTEGLHNPEKVLTIFFAKRGGPAFVWKQGAPSGSLHPLDSVRVRGAGQARYAGFAKEVSFEEYFTMIRAKS
jgi:hypothetical protein